MGAMAELSAEQRSALPMTWIDRLFARMEDRYGKLWSDRYGMAPRDRLLQTWAEDLSDLTREELIAGVNACRDIRLPPTLPEFRGLCRPPINYEAAFLDAVEQMRLREHGRDKWPSRAVFWAAVALGGDLCRFPYPALQNRWKAALDAKLRDSGLPEIPARLDCLPAPGGITTKAVARDALAQIRALIKKMSAPV